MSIHGWIDKNLYAIILRYHHATSELKIVYRKQDGPALYGENDTNWSGDQIDWKSTTGFLFQVWSAIGAISRQVRKQQTVAVSGFEAGY